MSFSQFMTLKTALSHPWLHNKENQIQARGTESVGNFSIVLTTLPINPSVRQGPPFIATPVPWLDQLGLATVQSQRSTTHTFQAKREIKDCSKMTRLDIQPWRPEIKQTQGQEVGAMAKSLGSLKQAVKSREAEGKLRGNSALQAFCWEGMGSERPSGRGVRLKLKCALTWVSNTLSDPGSQITFLWPVHSPCFPAMPKSSQKKKKIFVK